MTEVWNREHMLSDLQKIIICPMYKKGDKVCNNYTGISLLCVLYKLLTSI